MRLPLLALFAIALPAACADTQSELRAALAGFAGESPVQAEVTYEYWNQSGDKDGTSEEECTVSVRVKEDAGDLLIAWSRDTIATATSEVRAASADPERKTPMRRAMGDLSATVLSGYLDGTAELVRWLGQSEFLKEAPGDWKGTPVQVLTYKSTPRVNAQTKKYLKELDASVKVWVGAGGVPFAAERNVRIRGRALLVVSFESVESDTYEYAVSGDRLVVTRHARASDGSGTGGRNAQKTVATLTLIPASE